ncbi:hypothetical protein [Streptomyces meridianus]|uniref:Uncharacterized protein n=1 Tax=Streptomyces meridianus TaxID=2938945 RepID=A0ABT0X9G8_9ACTN|nr:hypothetical protein [Streptomyces meridianus]MCM2578357.1 hypothetical protein [Streptomyces meridianus]
MTATPFDALFDRGREALLARSHPCQSAPCDGDSRWGLSVLLRPDTVTAACLDRLAAEAGAVAGKAHWPTGAGSSSHFTVRTLEPYRSQVPADDPALGRHGRAMRAAATGVPPVRLRLTGLTLTPGSVMACAEPVDGAAGRLADALGEDGRYETVKRDIWYANVLHFAAPLESEQAKTLIDWVAARRTLDRATTEARRVELAHWTFPAGRPLPRALLTVPLTG